MPRTTVLDSTALDAGRLWGDMRQIANHPQAMLSLADDPRRGLISPQAVVIGYPMLDLVAAAVETLWQRLSMAGRPGIIGFDLHLTATGPRLIEINTNPGGLLIAALQTQAAARQISGLIPACAPPMDRVGDVAVAAFGGQDGLVAIVDDDPLDQFLWPEFLLFQAAFAQRGRAARILDPGQLQWDGTVLTDRRDGAVVHSVYNRLTDFDLSLSAHDALAQAWAAGAVVVCPDPLAHRGVADKTHLAALSSLEDLVPRCVIGDHGNWDRLWADRRHYFFKPRWGYGGKGVFRGDKISRTAWSRLIPHHYVAQEVVPPPRVPGPLGHMLKADLRAFALDGRMLLLAARLYDGQTTNFRTPGGGFAPVLTPL